MSANFFDDELHGGDAVPANGQKVVAGSSTADGIFGQPEGGYASEDDETDLSASSLWENDPVGKTWMNDWSGREETHAMFRQSYE
ncbi:hypothetical protein [Paenibacillus sp. MDMC362]|uniref:hypothetical protein n=1 Tax=Paenibacillus sp. MDMC362 TaxID=2977365 RepID=UPI000DC3B557|nr:hypothetical protein [Paenibacillus sp. MDMC362]RAR40349.1 hypothetical protein DP091_29050 [Paenibacillus sp. MDMC362]